MTHNDYLLVCPFCSPDTAGNHQPGCPNDPTHGVTPIKIGGPIGWVCPVCGRGCAPYVSFCPCKGPVDVPLIMWSGT